MPKTERSNSPTVTPGGARRFGGFSTLSLTLVLATLSCGDNGPPDPSATDPSPNGTDPTTTTTTSTTATNFPTNTAGQALCASSSGDMVVCACSDGMENDTDGLVDAADPQCTGAYDNDEASFATGIPGDNQSAFQQDCFFDGDTGSGNDQCRHDTRCVAPPNGSHCNNERRTGCANCLGVTPNGCDCFGCCTLTSNTNTQVDVILKDTCTSTNLGDPNACPVCTKVADCNNRCDACEYCVGGVTPGPGCTTNQQCDPGINPCAAGTNACATGFACVTGCCKPSTFNDG
jgi:hypothetical protein